MHKALVDQGPYEYVMSKNHKRRNLTPDQWAMIAQEAMGPLEEEARARQQATLKQNTKGEKPDTVTVEVNSPQRSEQPKRAPQSRDVAAKQFGTTVHKIRQAKAGSANLPTAKPQVAPSSGESSGTKGESRDLAATVRVSKSSMLIVPLTLPSHPSVSRMPASVPR